MSSSTACDARSTMRSRRSSSIPSAALGTSSASHPMAILHRLKSVRVALTFWYSLVLTGAIALFGYGVYLYLKQLQEAELERNLAEEVDWISNLMDLEKGRFPGNVPIDRLSEDIERRIF